MAPTKSHAMPRNQGIRKRYRKDGTLRGYEVRYRDPEGKIRGKTKRTLEEARKFQKTTAHDIQTGEYLAPEREATPWRAVADEWLEARRVNLRPRTIESYEGVLGRWLDHWDKKAIGKISREDVRAVLRDVRAAGRTEETEHRIFNVISAVFKYAVNNDYVREAPTQAVRAGRELRSTTHKTFRAAILTTAEATKIVDCLPEGRYRLYGLLGLWTGFRAGELAGLRVRNLDTLRAVVQVDETVQDLRGRLQPGQPKTTKSHGRRVPIPKDVMAEVISYIKSRRLGPDDYLFAETGYYFGQRNFYRRQWKEACKKAGLPTVRFHTLRHVFATTRAMQGVPPHVLKEWMGHTSITTTMNIYSHVYDEDASTQQLLERLYADRSQSASDRTVLPVAQADER